MFCLFSLVCAAVSAHVWPLSRLLSWLTLCTLGDDVVFSCGTLGISWLDPVPSMQIPLKRRLFLQAFNTQLLCLLVLQFSPSPSPLQVLFICPVSSRHPTAESSPARYIISMLELSDWWSWLMQILIPIKSVKKSRFAIDHDPANLNSGSFPTCRHVVFLLWYERSSCLVCFLCDSLVVQGQAVHCPTVRLEEFVSSLFLLMLKLCCNVCNQLVSDRQICVVFKFPFVHFPSLLLVPWLNVLWQTISCIISDRLLLCELAPTQIESSLWTVQCQCSCFLSGSWIFTCM